MKKTEIFMNNPIYLVLSILGISKIVICEFWYNYAKPKYNEKAKSRYMNTDSFIVHVKTEDIYKDIEKDVEERFDTSNYELERPLPKGKKVEVKIMEEFV